VSESGCRKREQSAVEAPEPKERLKWPDGGFGVRWKGRRKQPPKAPFSAALQSQVHRYIWQVTKRGLGGVVAAIRRAHVMERKGRYNLNGLSNATKWIEP
jgi:hypothetical protein